MRCKHRFLWLTLSIRPYHPSLLAGFQTTSCVQHRAVVGKFLLVGQHEHYHVKGSIGEGHRLSLLLWQCPACFVHLTWMVLEMGGKWPYRCCFLGCCFQDLFNTARSILVQFLSSVFSMRSVSVHVMHPYSSTDTTIAWK